MYIYAFICMLGMILWDFSQVLTETTDYTAVPSISCFNSTMCTNDTHKIHWSFYTCYRIIIFNLYHNHECHKWRNSLSICDRKAPCHASFYNLVSSINIASQSMPYKNIAFCRTINLYTCTNCTTKYRVTLLRISHTVYTDITVRLTIILLSLYIICTFFKF